ncbi:NAD-dependent epimerase/dehydratase family protein [Algoriphagus lutimaris]|uniref:NAD-dependent epimerase/dehydratase family protein n=1 Tax=Algoriphagus lutimaris TaxID=613197 RepID=UPI00196B8A9A|nr:NAD-dependent epimerase/dehydratase family protein [Algoriphagus lutimaris]MBN3520216.1 NAD-dependent epimerase/dehydratase family protein [Algoriphagus lutimaris]
MYNVIITGSTGMIGKGALLECLKSEEIQEVLLINRSPIEISSPKIKELLLQDFTQIHDYSEQLIDYDACFHCMGVSAVGMSEDKYHQLTFGVSKFLADTLYELNPDLVFCYVSGKGTDSTEEGRSMWARVKGKTENYILSLGFKKAFMFRPGFVLPEDGIKSKTKLYNTIYVLLTPFYSWIKNSKNVTTTRKIGKAMINTLTKQFSKSLLENKDINKLAE